MDKAEYTRLLSAASIDDTSKFVHPLLQKEKDVNTVLREILPKNIADSLCAKGSRLAHLYGLPKTHKASLSMRPILSATGTYNYNLAKWLEEKLKPLSVNEYTITDAISFSEEIRNLPINEDSILVSYDVTALFTHNVPLNKTINILVDKAFTNDWFNQSYDLNLQKDQLAKLLEIGTTNQLCQFSGQLFEQIDGVAMGSPLGPLMANVFLCHLEEKLTYEGVMPTLYKRYVDENDARVEDNSILRITLPFKDQTSANSVRRQITRSALLCNRCLLARNWNKTSCQRKSSLQSSINNVLCILFHVICAMQIMSAIQPDTSTSALWNTRTQRLKNISWKPMGTQASSKKANFAFSESVKGNLIASSTRCFLSKNAIPA